MRLIAVKKVSKAQRARSLYIRLFAFTGVLLLGLLLIQPSLALSDELKTRSIRSTPIAFSDHQSSKLKKDLPFSDLMFDSHNRVWLAGKSALWLFDHANKTLKKIRLRSDNKFPIRKLIHKNGFLFAASDRNLYRIELDPFKVLVFSHPSYKSGGTSSITSDSANIWWVHDDGLIKISTGKKTFVQRVADIPVKKAISWFDAKNRQLWLIKGGQVAVSDLRLKKPQNKVIYNAKYAFIGIQPLAESVLIHSNYTVLKFNQNQQLDQIIPVENKRKLIAFAVKPQLQSYLFSDQLLEIYDLKQNTRFQTFLQIPAKSNILGIKRSSLYSAVLTNQIPLLYKHSQKLSLATESHPANTKKLKAKKAQL